MLRGWCRVGLMGVVVAMAGEARGQVGSVDDLLAMSGPQLGWLYQNGAAGAVPSGRVRGTALPRPGSRLNRPMARAARVMWQGKIFRGEDSTAINRFFGVR